MKEQHVSNKIILWERERAVTQKNEVMNEE